jgi:CheY-like chemotaxis protein
MHILVVDNDRDTADLIGELLRLRGHRVQIAYDGDRATELVDADPPDLAVVDLAMPGMNGYELAEEISARSPDIRLVAFSGLARSMLAPAPRLEAAGIERCISKTAEPAELFEAIEGRAAS